MPGLTASGVVGVQIAKGGLKDAGLAERVRAALEENARAGGAGADGHWNVMVCGNGVGFALKTSRLHQPSQKKLDAESLLLAWQPPSDAFAGFSKLPPPLPTGKAGTVIQVEEAAEDATCTMTGASFSPAAEVLSTCEEHLHATPPTGDSQDIAKQLRAVLSMRFKTPWHVVCGSVTKRLELARSEYAQSYTFTCSGRRFHCLEHGQPRRRPKVLHVAQEILKRCPYLFIALFFLSYMTFQSVCTDEPDELHPMLPMLDYLWPPAPCAADSGLESHAGLPLCTARVAMPGGGFCKWFERGLSGGWDLGTSGFWFSAKPLLLVCGGFFVLRIVMRYVQRGIDQRNAAQAKRAPNAAAAAKKRK